MPFDPSIFQLANKPTVALQDPSEAMGKSLQLQALRQQNQLGGMQIQQQQQGMDDEAKMRSLSQSGQFKNYSDLADAAQKAGMSPKTVMGLREQDIAHKKKVAEFQETLGKVDIQRRGAIAAAAEDTAKLAAGAQNPDQFNAGLFDLAQRHSDILGPLSQGPDGKPVLPATLQKYFVSDPSQFQQNRGMAIGGALPVVEAVKLLASKNEERNGAIVPVKRDILGNETVGAPVAFKAQDKLSQLKQDLTNKLITPAEYDERKKKIDQPSTAQINVGKYATPAGGDTQSNPLYAQAKSISDLKQGLPARQGPQAAALNDLIAKIRQEEGKGVYDANQWTKVKRSQEYFSGQGKGATTLTSNDTLVGHAAEVLESLKGAGNDDTRVSNIVNQWLSRQTGQDAKYKNLKVSSKVFGSELASMLGEKDAHEKMATQALFDNVDSPASFTAAVNQAMKMAATRSASLANQWYRETGTDPIEMGVLPERVGALAANSAAAKEYKWAAKYRTGGGNTQPVSNTPKLGTVMDGHIFLGGDPANPKSWKKQ